MPAAQSASAYDEAMADSTPWLIREDASVPVLVALALRQHLGVRAPVDLPALRGLPVRAPDAAETDAAIESQWEQYWHMTVEPQAHPATGPLDLVPGFGTMIALPTAGAEELRGAIATHAETALAYAQHAHDSYAAAMRGTPGDSAYRAYANAIDDVGRTLGRPPHPFTLNVQVLPLSQRGIWWIGALTVAVTDGLRRDVTAFDRAIRPIIADLA